ncbi:MAG: hypothetical protein HYZ29_10890 [Myxococcales bacterium]|nr:hypothetical protein [Myxococcales bacterium]
MTPPRGEQVAKLTGLLEDADVLVEEIHEHVDHLARMVHDVAEGRDDAEIPNQPMTHITYLAEWAVEQLRAVLRVAAGTARGEGLATALDAALDAVVVLSKPVDVDGVTSTAPRQVLVRTLADRLSAVDPTLPTLLRADADALKLVGDAVDLAAGGDRRAAVVQLRDALEGVAPSFSSEDAVTRAMSRARAHTGQSSNPTSERLAKKR